MPLYRAFAEAYGWTPAQVRTLHPDELKMFTTERDDNG